MNKCIELIKEIRSDREAWLPLIDHADQVFPPENEFEDKNIGWYAGVIQENRPFFVECWATEGITMLTIFFSVIGLENKTAGELSGIFESIGYYKVIGTERHVALKTFTDGNDNEPCLTGGHSQSGGMYRLSFGNAAGKVRRASGEVFVRIIPCQTRYRL